MSKASVLPFALKTQAFTQKLAYLLEVLLWCFCCKREKKKKFKENELYELRFSGGKGYETA